MGSEMKPNLELIVEDSGTNRIAEIKAICEMVRTARDDAIGLDLKFEAYLLDMAVLALSENLKK